MRDADAERTRNGHGHLEQGQIRRRKAATFLMPPASAASQVLLGRALEERMPFVAEQILKDKREKGRRSEEEAKKGVQVGGAQRKLKQLSGFFGGWPKGGRSGTLCLI